MKTFLSILSSLLLATLLSAQQEVPPIRNFLRINKDFCTGGQPRPEHLQRLKDDGVKAIINLRQPGEHRAAEEEAQAKELGLRYFNIPFVYAAEDEKATNSLSPDDHKSPGVIHCTPPIARSLWMIRRVVRRMESRGRRRREKKVGEGVLIW